MLVDWLPVPLGPLSFSVARVWPLGLFLPAISRAALLSFPNSLFLLLDNFSRIFIPIAASDHSASPLAHLHHLVLSLCQL